MTVEERLRRVLVALGFEGWELEHMMLCDTCEVEHHDDEYDGYCTTDVWPHCEVRTAYIEMLAEMQRRERELQRKVDKLRPTTYDLTRGLGLWLP